MTETVDYLVFGAGSGNSILDPSFEGKKLALIDAGRHFGGTCLNVGCIPTKMYVHPADVAREARDAGPLGIRVDGVHADWRAIRDRIFDGRVDPISAAGEEYRETGVPHLDLVRERAKFVGDREIETTSGRRIRAEHLVIATGTRPRTLGVPGENGDRVHTSDTIMRIDDLPERITIIGGGIIACEFAHIFSSLGSEVTQVLRGDRMLKKDDRDVADTFDRIASGRWRIVRNAHVERFVENPNTIETHLSTGETLTSERVLVAAGRVVNSDRIDVAAAGYDMHGDGRIKVDEYLRVLRDGKPVDGVFALGDAIDRQQLKHIANEHARCIRHNLLHPDDLRSPLAGPVPAAMFTSPQVIRCGLTLDEAEEHGRDAVEIVQRYGDTAWGWALGDTESFVKLVVEKPSGLILGIHAIGPDAASLVQQLVQMQAWGRSVRGAARSQWWPHPAASEIIENALIKAEEAL